MAAKTSQHRYGAKLRHCHPTHKSYSTETETPFCRCQVKVSWVCGAVNVGDPVRSNNGRTYIHLIGLQVSAVANWPAQQKCPVDRGWRSVRASELGDIVNIADQRQYSLSRSERLAFSGYVDSMFDYRYAEAKSSKPEFRKKFQKKSSLIFVDYQNFLKTV